MKHIRELGLQHFKNYDMEIKNCVHLRKQKLETSEEVKIRSTIAMK